MSATRRLTTTLTETLHAKADQANLARTPVFDPTRRPALGPDAYPRPQDPRERSPHPAGPRRFRLAVAAVALAVVLVGAAVATAMRDNGDGADTTTVAEAPDGWLVPGWMPEGMELWDISWSGPDDSAPGSATDEGWNSYQLFGDPDADRAIYVDANSHIPDGMDASGLPYPEFADIAAPVGVRGRDGWAAPAIDTPGPAETVVWIEGDAMITAYYKGMTLTEAVDALDGLERRSDRLVDGYAPPADGSLPLKGEWSTTQRTLAYVDLLYSQGLPTADRTAGRRTISVTTSIDAGTPLGYIDEWFWDGSETMWAEDGSLRDFDPDSGTLGAYWPDGREVHLFPMPDQPLAGQYDQPTMERIADSLIARGEHDLTRMRDAFLANIEALPVLASTEASVGALELHGDAEFQRLCLRRPGRPALDCGLGQSAPVSPDAQTVSRMGSWVIDGTWYVAVASSGFEAGVFGDRGEQPEDDPLAAEVTTDGAWRLQFLAVPAEVRMVDTNLDDGLGAFTRIGRPST